MGRSLRDQVPRQAHADYRLSPRKRDPVAILEEFEPGAGSRSGSHPVRPYAARSICLPARIGGRDGL